MSLTSRLTWRDTISEAVAAITQRPVRTLLTALGTILGVGAFVATNGLAETARAQVSSRFDALKATEVRIQDANPDGTNPFPNDVTQRLEALNGINHAGLYYTVPDNGTLQPRTTATRPVNQSTAIPVIAADPGAIAAALGTKGSARMVGWAMNQSHFVKPAVPAHRVVNRQGRLTGKMHFSPPQRMQQLLEKEGIRVVEDQVVNFNKHFWDPNEVI